MIEFQHRQTTIFPTTIIEFKVDQHEDFNKEIIDYLYDQREKDPNRDTFSSRGPNNWHSNDNLHKLEFEWSKKLKELIYNASSLYVGGAEIPKASYANCWSIIFGTAGSSNYHTHPGAQISGTYYLQVPDDLEEDGKFCVPDQRTIALNTHEGASTWRYSPKVGQGLVFGSWMPHYVESHFSKDDRISISWNITIEDDETEGPVHIV